MIRDGMGKAAFVRIAVDGVNRGVVVGEFRWNWDPETPAGYDDRFYTYCADARTSLVNGDTVAIRSTDLLTVAGVPDAGGKAAWLFNTYAPSIRGRMDVQDPRTRAASLQVAIWETMLDTASNLSTGTIKLVSNGDVREKAKNYLLALYRPDGSYRTTEGNWLDLSASRDQIVLPGLTWPGTLVALAAGGLALTIVLRRRQIATI
jgi:hypothetical protein